MGCSDLDLKKFINLSIILQYLSSLMVPEIFRDWDRKAKYSKNYYSCEWVRVKREYKYLVMIYSLENTLLSLPLLYTCGRLMYRHTLLTPLDVELTSLTSAYFLIFFIPGRNSHKARGKSLLFLISVFFTLIGVVQFNLFVFFNKSGHTWARLLENEEKNGKEIAKLKDETIIIPHMLP